MTFLKSCTPGGKKQTPMPGPNSAAYKRIVAAKKAAAGKGSAAGKHGSGKSGKKNSPADSRFSSLKARQLLLERVKRAIWASVMEINEAIITLAKAGNFHAARALFDFAGVYSLPASGDEKAGAAPVPVAAEKSGSANDPDPVDNFFRSIGMPAACAEPEAGLAGASL